MILSASTLIIIVSGGLWPFGGDDETAGGEGTIGRLEEREIQLKTDPVLPGGDTALAREQYRLFLEISANHPELRREAMRRLADLNMTAGEDDQLNSGTVDSAYFDQAIALYLGLIENNPDYADSDLVLYQLARAYDSIGKGDQAMTVLNQLVARYPDSKYFDEAQFRRGETFFVNRQ